MNKLGILAAIVFVAIVVGCFVTVRKPGQSGFPRPQLSEIRKGVDDPGRIGSDGRRQVYLHAARRAPVPFGQVRPHPAPELQIHGRRRP